MQATLSPDTVRRIDTVRKISAEYVDGNNPRRIANDIRPDAQWALVFPSQGRVLVATLTEMITFECTQGQSSWSLAMADVLIGLGFYISTVSVPAKLVTPVKDEDPHYRVTKAINTKNTVCSLLK